MQPIIIAQVLAGQKLKRPQTKFVQSLLTHWLTVQGRFNYVNMARYLPCHERTLRRWFARPFPWAQFNGELLEMCIPSDHEVMVAMDHSFISKAGHKTPGLGRFFNGCIKRMMTGLEAAVVAVVDLNAKTAYVLDAMATPPSPPKAPRAKPQPDASGKVPKSGRKVRKLQSAPGTRFHAILAQLQRVRPYMPARVRYLAVDGAFTACPFITGVRELGLEVIGKLRHDVALRRPYRGPQRLKGRQKRIGDPISCAQPEASDWVDEGVVEHGYRLTSGRFYYRSIGLFIKVARLEKIRPAGQTASKSEYVLLFSTDLELSGKDILRFYSARFQIEFLFRDGKGFTGLTHCQSRQLPAINFHWNAALTAVNLAKIPTSPQAPESVSKLPHAPNPRFSMASRKRLCTNTHLLQVFCSGLGLDWTSIKSRPDFNRLLYYGCLVT